MYAFVSLWEMNATLAYVVQTVIAVTVNFALDWRYTWGDRRVGFWRSMYRFSVLRFVMIVLNSVLFTLLID